MRLRLPPVAVPGSATVTPPAPIAGALPQIGTHCAPARCTSGCPEDRPSTPRRPQPCSERRLGWAPLHDRNRGPGVDRSAAQEVTRQQIPAAARCAKANVPTARPTRPGFYGASHAIAPATRSLSGRATHPALGNMPRPPQFTSRRLVQAARPRRDWPHRSRPICALGFFRPLVFPQLRRFEKKSIAVELAAEIVSESPVSISGFGDEIRICAGKFEGAGLSSSDRGIEGRRL